MTAKGQPAEGVLHSECCMSMDLALARAKPGDTPGMKRQCMVSLSNGDQSYAVNLVLPKASKSFSSEYAKYGSIEINYCPFCGRRQERVLPGQRRSLP